MSDKKPYSRNGYVRKRSVRSKSSRRPVSSSKEVLRHPSNQTRNGLKPTTDGYQMFILSNHLMIPTFLHLLCLINMICHGREYLVQMIMVNPASKWTGLQRPTNLVLCDGQLWRNIIRLRFVDNCSSRHMIGDISHLYQIQNLHCEYVSFAGKEERKRSQMGIVLNDVKNF